MFETGYSQALVATLDQEDEILAQQAPQDRTAFIKLYRQYVKRVYRYVLIRLGSATEAQKLTAQVFQLAYNQIARYQGDTAFASWLLGIARRELGNYLQREHSLATAPPQAQLSADPQAHLLNLTLALSTLPADLADALALRIFAGLSAAQVAQVIDNNEASTKLMLRQALRNLQERLTSVQETQEWIEIEMKL